MCLHVLSIIPLIMNQWFSNAVLRKIIQRAHLKMPFVKIVQTPELSLEID